MGPFIIVIFVIFVIPASIIFFSFIYPDLSWTVMRAQEKRKETNRIKFKTFLLMYEMSPSFWDISCNWQCIYQPKGRHHHDKFKFSFNFIDFLRYCYFVKNTKKQKQCQEKNKEVARYLEYFKRDIANYEKQNKAYTEQMLKEIWQDEYTPIQSKDGDIYIKKRKKG